MSNVKTQLRSQLETQLESRGIKLNAADIAALLEDVSPKASHVALSYAMDLIRPFSAGMGLRVNILTDAKVELILPARTRNLDDNKEIHAGALLAGSLEAARMLWQRHAPLGNFQIRSNQTQIEIFKSAQEDVRIRLELGESLRETILADLRRKRRAKVEMQAQIYDHHDQAVAEVGFTLELAHAPGLGSPL